MRTDAAHVVRTPEGVAFAWREAGPWSRFLAWAIDAGVIAALLTAGAVGIAVLAGVSPGAGSPLLYLWVFAVTSGYFVYGEWRGGGATPGKRALGLRVLREDGLRVGLAASAIRNLLRFVDALPAAYGVALAAAALGRAPRRLGDRVAGTVVVIEPRARPPELASLAAPAPDPDLVERVARLDAAARDLLLAALARRERLEATARIAIFAALAPKLERRLGVRRQPHESDERFCARVAGAAVGAWT